MFVHGFFHFPNNFFVELTPNTLYENFSLEQTQNDLSLIERLMLTTVAQCSYYTRRLTL